MKTHLLPKYGKIDEVDKQTLERCIDHWHMTWQRVRGRTLEQINSDYATDEGMSDGIVACKPWFDEEMPLPKKTKICWRCWRWESSHFNNSSIEANRHESKARVKKNKGPSKKQERRSRLEHRWREPKSEDRRYEKIKPQTQKKTTQLTPKNALKPQDAERGTQQKRIQTGLLYPTVKLRRS